MRGRPYAVIEPTDSRYRRVVGAAQKLRAEEDRVDTAREELVLTMREAADAGLSIRAIAEAADLRPETVSRKLSAPK